MDSHDLAYIAGFFDGEGCVGIYRNSRGTGYGLAVQIVQNDSGTARPLLEKVRAEWGGSINERIPRDGKVKLSYQVGSHAAARLLADLLPYLRGKYDQARLAIAWQAPRERWTGRTARGRLTARPADALAFDEKVARLIRALKHQDIDRVMADQADLVEVEHTLRQILNYKGT